MIRDTAREKRTHAGRVALVGSYVPRQCGIATFSNDLLEGLAAADRKTSYFAVPLNDEDAGYEYPSRVRFEVAENDITSYRRAADFLNINSVDLVSLQHEYGIYGGPAGSHILALLRDLRMPVVTTLHTILKEPNADQMRVMDEITHISERVVVMTQLGERMLREIYKVPAGKIDVIPHGIPDVPFVDPNFYKDLFGVEGRRVLLTFGLLSPNKGIENVIEALPAILKDHPDVVYMVLGATHPKLLRQEGESYRLTLERLARSRGVEQHVIFYNRFVSLEELIEFIGVADVYVSPYLHEAQVVSGTLAYACGAGKAVVSTPYWHAKELLAEERGLLVPFANPPAIAERVNWLLDNESERHAMRKRAYMAGREMTWPRTCARYIESFQRAREERTRHPRAAFVARTLDLRPRELPAPRLDHLRRLTDGTGILQHAIFIVPNYSEGYATDDNARALMTAVLLEEMGEEEARQAHGLASHYLAFLWHAFNTSTGRFRNFLSYERKWLEEIGSEDSHGRALWGLGTVVGRSRRQALRATANRLFDLSLPIITQFTSPRAWAFSLLGIHEYFKPFDGDRTAGSVMETLAGKLMASRSAQTSADWPWFEDEMSYCNAELPHALLVCGSRMSRPDMTDAALGALDWLARIQTSDDDGHFVPIGSNGFYRRGGERARFDQQPVEAHSMVAACLAALHVTGDPRWRVEAQRAFDWFMGANDLHLPVHDPSTGGCRDGVHPDRVNQNQGAEATLSYLLSLLEMRINEQP